VVPNALSLPPNPARPAPDGTELDANGQRLFTDAQAVQDYANFNSTTNSHIGHGTLVASVAGGRVFGVASKADLVVVKWKNGIDPVGQGHYVLSSSKLAALCDAFRWIFADVQRTNRQGRAVINFSAGKSLLVLHRP
jgi:hypothetical protein